MTAVHTGLLGALLTFTPIPIYPSYVATTTARGTDPLSDQQLAGLLMWIPAGIILTLMGLALFLAWLGESERRTSARAGILVLVAGGWLSGYSTNADDGRIAGEMAGGHPMRGREIVAYLTRSVEQAPRYQQ